MAGGFRFRPTIQQCCLFNLLVADNTRMMSRIWIRTPNQIWSKLIIVSAHRFYIHNVYLRPAVLSWIVRIVAPKRFPSRNEYRHFVKRQKYPRIEFRRHKKSSKKIRVPTLIGWRSSGIDRSSSQSEYITYWNRDVVGYWLHVRTAD